MTKIRHRPSVDENREAILYTKLKDERVRCHLCLRRCHIEDGKRGFCRTRKNEGGVLHPLTYGRVSAQHVAPIEIKPFFHFFPGSRAFSLGSIGCNFRCPGCQNWEIAHSTVEKIDAETVYMAPETAVSKAEHLDCQGLSWTYNEPTLWWEYVLDGAKLAKGRGLYTTLVTNGYFTPRALDLIAPFMDAIRIDVKGFTQDSYRRLADIGDFSRILRNARRAKKRWNVHVEIITNIIPGLNDDGEQLRAIARWIYEELGKDTPWHVTRFYPHREWREFSRTPISTLEEARQIGLDAGIRFVYLGNVPGHGGENTMCPACGTLLIERYNSSVLNHRLKDGKCARCGDPIPIVGEVKTLEG